MSWDNPDKNKKQHHRHRKDNAINIIAVTAVSVILLIAFLLPVFRKTEKGKENPTAPKAETVNAPNARGVLKNGGETLSISKSAETVLVIGLDKSDEQIKEEIGDFYNEQMADFLMYMVFDNENMRVDFIQINRDTICEVPWLSVNGMRGGTQTEQICFAHIYGSGGKDSCENTAEAVNMHLFNAPVDHYLSFSLDSIPAINDVVGGVEVTINDDFSSVDKTLVQGETIRLNGRQAEHFVRARSGVGKGENTERMARHRQYLESFVKASRAAYEKNPNLSADAYNAVKNSLVTDLTSAGVQRFADRLNTYELGEIRHAAGTSAISSETGWVEFYVDKDDLWSIVKETLTHK